MKKLFLLISLLVSFGSLGYANSVLVIELIDGCMYRYELQEKPVLTFSNTVMTINKEGSALSTSYERSDVKRFFFDTGSDIQGVIDSENTVSITQIGDNQIKIKNLSLDERIIIADVAGKLYNDSMTRSDTEAFIDLNACPKGIYIINIGKKQSIKMTRK